MSRSSSASCVYVSVAIAISVGAIFGIIALARGFTTVPPGHVGVVVTRGNLRAIGPGRHGKRIFGTTVTFLSTKTQLLEQSHLIPTKEGLAVNLATAVQYHLDEAKAGKVYEEVGEEYSEKLIEPAAASIIRSLTSVVEAKALYTDGREEIQRNMTAKLREALDPRGVIVEGVYLKEVVLPEQLQNSIELKAQAEQESKRMEFKLEQEQLEAQRKSIEAEGIANFQRIVSEGISDQLLKWKAVEATIELANSANSKVVVMGNGQNDLPVLLNG